MITVKITPNDNSIILQALYLYQESLLPENQKLKDEIERTKKRFTNSRQ